MKKVAVLFASFAFIAGIFFISSCKTDDTGKPVITLTGGEKVFVTQFNTFTDPGSSATDDEDGTVTVTVTGTVNINSAGEYTLTYSATDAAGNKGEATRTVVVDGAQYVSGGYTTEDFTGSTSNGTYPETITKSTTTDNKINFTKFAFYVNGAVYGTISGTTITIPQQTVNCGNPAANRSFTGTGSYAKDFTSFTLNYTEVTNGTTVTGSGVYTKN